MRNFYSFVIVTIAALLGSHTSTAFMWQDPQPLDNGGGTQCAACIIVLNLMDQMARLHNQTIDKELEQFCALFPSPISTDCEKVVAAYGPIIIDMITQGLGPDDVCQGIKVCTDPQCRIYPPGHGYSEPALQRIFAKAAQVHNLDGMPPWLPTWLKNLIDKLANNHEPLVDLDDDEYSSVETLRGGSWRGKDCNDLDDTVHPGRARGSSVVDYNCNGIHGVSGGVSYKDMLCEGTQPMGVAVLGDSVGAHFEIPPSYLTAADIKKGTYDGIMFLLENEFDWPERSATTGYAPNSTDVPVQSLYLKMRDHNRCNHRDFQNCGVNGARSGSMKDNVMFGLTRNQTHDHPLILILELVGNDVCNGHPTLDRMTTPQEFETNILATLNYLDTILPSGSHIMTVGLADGRILWNSLHNRTHPIGVTYEVVYEFLNCLQISPCWVWMNQNETVRNAGSARAAELSAVYSKIIDENAFKHFDVAYMDFPFKQIIQKWESEGGQAWQLIEPVDGFHPNQIANALLGDFIWQELVTSYPGWIGPENPNNAKIDQMFGDQGGY